MHRKSINFPQSSPTSKRNEIKKPFKREDTLFSIDSVYLLKVPSWLYTYIFCILVDEGYCIYFLVHLFALFLTFLLSLSNEQLVDVFKRFCDEIRHTTQNLEHLCVRPFGYFADDVQINTNYHSVCHKQDKENLVPHKDRRQNEHATRHHQNVLEKSVIQQEERVVELMIYQSGEVGRTLLF